MDSANTQLSTSIISKTQDPFKIPNQKDLLKYLFKAKKMVISFAIKKTFPFLETLRDHELISDEFYEEQQLNLRKEVPVCKVVYDTLRALEEKFDRTHLNILFNEIHLREYPELYHIHEEFTKVIQNIEYMQDGHGADPLEGPAGPLSLEPGTGENVEEDLTSEPGNAAIANGTAPLANEVSEHSLDTEEDRAMRNGVPSGERDALEGEQASSHPAQEPEQAGAELSEYAMQSSPCFINLVDIKKESPSSHSKAEYDQGRDVIEISSDDLTDISGGEENPEVSIRARKRSRDAAGLRKPSECRKHHRKRVKRQNSFSGSSADEAPQRDDYMVADPDNVENKSNCRTGDQERAATDNGILRVLDWRRKLAIRYKTLRTQAKKRGIQSTQTLRGRRRGRRPGNSKPLMRRKRGPRIRKDRNMNFDVPELPVTCGKAKGTLYKEKLMQGSASKCILSENGEAWLTLREFEIEGGKERCKNWRLSVRCGGWTLKELIKKELLPNPPRTKRRKLMRMPPDSTLYDPCPNNYNVCVVCNRSGTLYCCDSCPRSFHMSCHIQHIDPKRDPWYCIFCSVMTIMENPSQNQYYQESEVLVRPMDYINDLKCKLVLLKIYSNPKSPFFSQEPYHGRDHLPGDPRSMCLNRVKDKLRRKKYTQVGAFVRDMHLIFENHKTFYKSRSIIMLGFQLEKEFDTNFKEIFRIK